MESAPERKADPRAERGLTSMSNQFVPRGQWIFGASASYSTHTNKDYTFLVIEDINSDGYTFKVTPLIAYAIRDNMAIGVKFIYSRSLLRIDSGSSVSISTTHCNTTTPELSSGVSTSLWDKTSASPCSTKPA